MLKSQWLIGFVPTSEEHQRHQARFAKDTFTYESVEEQQRRYAYGQFRSWHHRMQDMQAEENLQLPSLFCTIPGKT